MSELQGMALGALIVILSTPAIHSLTFWAADRWDKWRRS